MTGSTDAPTPPADARSRLGRIVRTFARFRLDTLLSTASIDTRALPWPAALAWRLNPLRALPTPSDPPARRLRMAIESLGPVFVKFGQILSTRRDLLPPDYADELAILQDRVAPFPGTEARTRIESALGAPLESVFARFDTEPMASASVAQVHAARLHDGSEVVAKVIRPGIEVTIRDDLALLRTIATTLERISADARRLHLIEVVEDFEATLIGELDLLREARNTARLRQNFAASPLLYVPRVHWDHTRSSVLVLERIHGIPIARTEALVAAGTDMRVLAERGVETFFTQVFVHNFFHADMHPGNIFVDVSDPASPRYIAIDCAIIGSLTEDDQRYLAQNLLAFFHRDYAEVARLHVESGWIPADTDTAEFEQVIRDVCDPIFARPLSEISFGHFLVQLFRTARRFHMEVQPQLVLLQKTLLNIEGLGRQLYPDLDLWATAKPFMERWMAERVGPIAALRSFADRAPELVDQLPRLPALVLDADRRLGALERAERIGHGRIEALERELATLERRHHRMRLAAVAAASVGVLALAGVQGAALGIAATLLALVAIVVAWRT